MNLLTTRNTLTSLAPFGRLHLLGTDPMTWLNEALDERYKRLTQPPGFYWTFKKIMNRTGVADRRLLAMRTNSGATLGIPGAGEPKVSQLLADPASAASHLSRVCLSIFQGDGAQRTLARQLDIAAYGQQIESRSADIWSAISALRISRSSH